MTLMNSMKWVQCAKSFFMRVDALQCHICILEITKVWVTKSQTTYVEAYYDGKGSKGLLTSEAHKGRL